MLGFNVCITGGAGVGKTTFAQGRVEDWLLNDWGFSEHEVLTLTV